MKAQSSAQDSSVLEGALFLRIPCVYFINNQHAFTSSVVLVKTITLILHINIKLTEASVFLRQGSHVQHYVNICLFA